MIFPMLLKRSKTIVFDDRLSIFDKHIYSCLFEVSCTSGFRGKNLFKMIGGDLDDSSFNLSLSKLEKFGYICTEIFRDEDGNAVCLAIGDSQHFPKFDLDKIKAFRFLDSKPMLRNVSFYALMKRKLVRRQGEFSNTFFPIIDTGGFSAYKTEENSILYYFFRKRVDDFEDPDESLEELHYSGVNVKKFCKILIENMGRVSMQLSEDAPVRSVRRFIRECHTSTKIGLSIFLEGCVFIAKEANTPEEFYKIIANLSKSKKRIITKKEKKPELNIISNPKIPAKFSAVVDFWNTKNLVKHKNYNSKTVVNACKIMNKMIKGIFDEKKIKYKMEDFYSAIETMEAMANDPNVKPTGLKQKEFLKKMSLENFLYSNYTGKSKFIDIMESGSLTLTKPYSEDSFNGLCKITQKITNTKLTSRNKNSLAVFINAVKLFFDNNRKRFEYEATVLKICASIIRSLTKNGRWLNYNFLMSEDMRANYILKICLEEGFIIGVKRQTDSLVYKKIQR